MNCSLVLVRSRVLRSSATQQEPRKVLAMAIAFSSCARVFVMLICPYNLQKFKCRRRLKLIFVMNLAGCGFVKFERWVDAELAQESLHGQPACGRRLNIRFATR